MFVLVIGFVLSVASAGAEGNVIGKFVQDNITVEVARGEGTEISVTLKTPLTSGSSFLYADLVIFDSEGRRAVEYKWVDLGEPGQTETDQAVYNDGSEEPSFVIDLSVSTENNGVFETDQKSISTEIDKNDNVTFTVSEYPTPLVLSVASAVAEGNVIGKFVQDNITVEVARGEGTEISVTLKTPLTSGSSFLYADLVIFDSAGSQASEYAWDEIYETGQTASVQAVYNDGSEEPSFVIYLSVSTENNGMFETDQKSISTEIDKNDNVTFTV
ncbi:MAG: hypothetical protein GY795_30990, partial [Desulfobacterales bacterium]|nr:hypothetical protein [Desulfobacterales bacterium]